MHAIQFTGSRYHPYYNSTIPGNNAFLTLMLNNCKQPSKLTTFLMKKCKGDVRAGLICAVKESNIPSRMFSQV